MLKPLSKLKIDIFVIYKTSYWKIKLTDWSNFHQRNSNKNIVLVIVINGKKWSIFQGEKHLKRAHSPHRKKSFLSA